MKFFSFFFILSLICYSQADLSPIILFATKTSEIDHFSNSLREKQLSSSLQLQNVLTTIFTQMQTKNTNVIKDELLTFFKKIDKSVTELNKT
jgi:hypothetical protein